MPLSIACRVSCGMSTLPAVHTRPTAMPSASPRRWRDNASTRYFHASLRRSFPSATRPPDVEGYRSTRVAQRWVADPDRPRDRPDLVAPHGTALVGATGSRHRRAGRSGGGRRRCRMDRHGADVRLGPGRGDRRRGPRRARRAAARAHQVRHAARRRRLVLHRQLAGCRASRRPGQPAPARRRAARPGAGARRGSVRAGRGDVGRAPRPRAARVSSARPGSRTTPSTCSTGRSPSDRSRRSRTSTRCSTGHRSPTARWSGASVTA